MKRLLLRSYSSPILNSWPPGSATGSSPESSTLPQLTRTRSVCMTASIHCEDSQGRSAPMRFALDLDLLKDPTLKPKRSLMVSPKSSLERKEGHKLGSILLTSSGLGEVATDDGVYAVAAADGVHAVAERERPPQTMVVGGGGRGCGGGRGLFDGSGSQDSGSWNGNDSTDLYYEKMIEANPGNALLLANYAKFLKEVKRDYAKAEEYCGRAILANPNDGDLLSLYADLIWQTQNDAERAEAYFDRAVKTDPNDCYVLASYARFLWDAEDGEEEDDGREANIEYEVGMSHGSSKFFQEGCLRPPMATAS